MKNKAIYVVMPNYGVYSVTAFFSLEAARRYVKTRSLVTSTIIKYVEEKK